MTTKLASYNDYQQTNTHFDFDLGILSIRFHTIL